MQPSRRQFVTASLAGVPLLVSGGVAASQGRSAGPRPGAADPVLDNITANLRELIAEGDGAPAARKGAARGIEATLGVLAAHFEAHYDAPLKQALKRREARAGRAALVDDVVRFAREHKHDTVTHEAISDALARLETHGLAACVRDGRRAVRQARLRAPEAVLAAAATAQYDYCADLRWMIEITVWISTLVCAFALLEPTPGGESACGAILLFLGSMQAMVYWFC